MKALTSLIVLCVATGCGRAAIDHSAMPEPPKAPLAEVPAEGDAGATKKPGADGGPTVVLEGTPEVPAALKERLDRYLDARSAAAEWIGDDGKTLLVSTRFAEVDQIHLLKAPGGARTQLTFGTEPVSGASLTKDGSAVLYKSDVGGNEQYQIFRLDLATGKRTLLTDGKSRHGDYVWSHDGARIAYTNNARNGKDMDLYLGDGRSAASGRLLLERAGHWYPIEFTRDGKQILVGEYVSINDSRLYLVDVASKNVRRLTPESPVASYRAATLDPKGQTAYVATDRDGEFVELHAIDLKKPDAPWTPLTRSIKWNVEELALSPDGSTLAFVVNEEGYGVLHLLDTRTKKVRVAPGIPKGVVRGLRFAQKSGALALTNSGAKENGDAFSYDLRTGKLTRWTESEVGGLDTRRFAEPRLVRYESFDQRSIPAFVYEPKGDGPFPVVVWIHGGPESQSRPTFSSVFQYLVAESGAAVVVPNVRGSDGYGKSYLLLDNGEKREDSVKDIGALLDFIAKDPKLDAKRAAVVGGSYGGYMVLASLFHYPKRLVAGVDVVGIRNFVTFLENTQAYRRDLRRAEYGDERDPKMKEHLLRISPTTNAGKIESALFVAHGANDPRVPVGETDQIVREVRKSGKDVWYMVAKNEGHGFRKKENRDLFYRLTVLFLEKHLGVAHSK